MNLAIASPSSTAYSETFIHMQMERLPCVLRIHGGPVARETIPGGAIAPLKCLRGLIDTVIEVGFKGKPLEGSQSRELARRLKKSGAVVVLANFGQTGVALSPVCQALGIPLVVHFHGFDAHMHRVCEEYSGHYKDLGKSAAAIIAVSVPMREALIRQGIPAGKITLLRYGVDQERFPLKSEFPVQPLFFGVGRFVDKKAPYLTLLAFKEALSAMPSAKLVLAGDGPLWEATRNLSTVLGLDQAVTFPGVVKPTQVADWMQRATAFVQHSIIPFHGVDAGDSEGTPVAVLEALTSGLPVIATRHAGIGEVVIHEQTGLLVEERDVRAMASAMIRLASDTPQAIRMGQAARADALSKYTATRYISGLKTVLETCV